MIAVVDTGGANLASVVHALERLGVSARLTSEPRTIRAAAKVILPGVGAAAESMRRLTERGLVEVLRGLDQPTLGICLGMQLLFTSSDEGDTDCLGILPGRVERLVPGPGIRVPHMGWNRVEPLEGAAPLWAGLPRFAHFYFVHSYACPDGPWVLATTEHGRPVPAICRRDNFFGVQFHPERSGAQGARLLASFLAL